MIVGRSACAGLLLSSGRMGYVNHIRTLLLGLQMHGRSGVGEPPTSSQEPLVSVKQPVRYLRRLGPAGSFRSNAVVWGFFWLLLFEKSERWHSARRRSTCKRGCVCEALTSSWEPRVPVFAIRQHLRHFVDSYLLGATERLQGFGISFVGCWCLVGVNAGTLRVL